jgi:hypothetical protein
VLGRQLATLLTRAESLRVAARSVSLAVEIDVQQRRDRLLREIRRQDAELATARLNNA